MYMYMIILQNDNLIKLLVKNVKDAASRQPFAFNSNSHVRGTANSVLEKCTSLQGGASVMTVEEILETSEESRRLMIPVLKWMHEQVRRENG